jgi:hypothetical protein
VRSSSKKSEEALPEIFRLKNKIERESIKIEKKSISHISMK